MSVVFLAPRLLRAAAFCLLLAVLTLGLSRAASATDSVSLSDASSGGTPTLTTLHTFSALVQALNSDGATPPAGLVQGRDGDFYGTASYGGTYGYGTIFKITSSGAFVVVHNFSTEDGNGNNVDGGNPYAPLIVGSDGNFYGTAQDGGAHGNGTVFRMTSTGTFTTIYSFSTANVNNANADGSHPFTGLVQGRDGDFYGSTALGGVNGFGVIFKVTPTGTFTTLLSLSANSGDFSAGPSSLVEGQDGEFYGTTSGSGTSDVGTVFKITSAGVLTVLHNFSSADNNGTYPAGVILGSDGNFYGTTGVGGAAGGGTIFKVTPGGTLTTLYAFSLTDGNGNGPQAGLIQASDGNFYGTTQRGGAGDTGSIFQITPSGVLTYLYYFSATSSMSPYGNNDGASPFGGLCQGSDGKFYGATQGGGTNGNGTVFQLSVPGLVVTPIWSATAVSAAPSGISHILWTRSDGAAGLWTMNAAGVETTIGPTYGPYSGWSAKAVATANDGTSRVLWVNTDGHAGVWTFSANDTETTEGPAYGPYSGWTAKSIGVAGDGTSRVLWDNVNGQAGVWSFNTSDVETIIGTTYGPYSGWTAKSISATSDASSRVLWTNTNGTAGLWSFNANDVVTKMGMVYGPYSGWTAGAVGTAGDGTSRVLWTNVNGAAGIWSFNASDMETIEGTVYGPYSGYGAVALGVAADGTARVLWDRSDRAAGVWTFGANDAKTVVGSVYGPY